ncbi:hypothetical protein ACTHQF_14195 [Pedobacter sp. SAFR-022]|uniref:hypothetical protein n=1 Tax=Pedobacter sp. SAFR-022 TaxID=3436861 RepID=UPI003F81A570
MEIVKYVAELIQFHKEVGIDGFGTIYKKKSPGRYDSVSRSFLPPGSTTAFKKEISDSSLLINELVAKENVSREVAADAISRFAILLSQQLADQGYADFGPIGVLRQVNGQTVLEQHADFKPGREFFGLPKIEEPVAQEPVAQEPLKQEPEVKQPEEAVTVIPVTPVIPVTIPVSTVVEEEAPAKEQAQEPVAEPMTKQEAIVTENLLEEENPGKETNEEILNEIRRPIIENRINYTIKEEPPAESGSLLTKVAVILLAILLLSVAAYYLYPRISSSFTEEPTVPNATVEKLRADSLARIARDQSIVDSTAQADSLAAARLKMEKAPSVDSLKTVQPVAKAAADTVVTYEVIGASVLNEKEASWFIETMKRSGIKAKVVHNAPGKRLKMSIATLKDEQSAKEARDRLGEKLKIKGLYIYKNKPQ